MNDPPSRIWSHIVRIPVLAEVIVKYETSEDMSTSEAAARAKQKVIRRMRRPGQPFAKIDDMVIDVHAINEFDDEGLIVSRVIVAG